MLVSSNSPKQSQTYFHTPTRDGARRQGQASRFADSIESLFSEDNMPDCTEEFERIWVKLCGEECPHQQGRTTIPNLEITRLLKALLRQRKSQKVVDWLIKFDGDFLKFCGKDIKLDSVTWLHCASWFGWVDVLVDNLTKHMFSDVNLRDSNERTPGHYAAYSGYAGVLCLLANIGLKLEIEDKNRDTCFLLGIRRGHVAFFDHPLVIELFKSMSDLSRYRCFASAIKSKNTSMLRKLVSLSDGNVDPLGEEQMTPLLLAAVAGNLMAMKLLIDHGANSSRRDDSQSSLLHLACESNAPEVIDFALSTRSSLEDKNKHGSTPLDWCFLGEKMNQSAVHLINLGANVWTRDAKGETILHTACIYGCLSGIRLAIEQGICIDIQNNYGNTALHKSVAAKNPESIATLIRLGASRFLMNNVKKTPLDIGVEDRVTWSVILALLNLPFVPTCPTFSRSGDGWVEAGGNTYGALFACLLSHKQSCSECSGYDPEFATTQRENKETDCPVDYLEILDILLGGGASAIKLKDIPGVGEQAAPFVRGYPMFFARKMLVLCRRQRAKCRWIVRKSNQTSVSYWCYFDRMVSLPFPLQEMIIVAAYKLGLSKSILFGQKLRTS